MALYELMQNDFIILWTKQCNCYLQGIYILVSVLSNDDLKYFDIWSMQVFYQLVPGIWILSGLISSGGSEPNPW